MPRKSKSRLTQRKGVAIDGRSTKRAKKGKAAPEQVVNPHDLPEIADEVSEHASSKRRRTMSLDSSTSTRLTTVDSSTSGDHIETALVVETINPSPLVAVEGRGNVNDVSRMAEQLGEIDKPDNALITNNVLQPLETAKTVQDVILGHPRRENSFASDSDEEVPCNPIIVCAVVHGPPSPLRNRQSVAQRVAPVLTAPVLNLQEHLNAITAVEIPTQLKSTDKIMSVSNTVLPSKKVKILHNIQVVPPRLPLSPQFLDKGKKIVSFYQKMIDEKEDESSSDENESLQSRKKKKQESSSDDDDIQFVPPYPRMDNAQHIVTLLARFKEQTSQIREQLSSQIENWPLITKMVQLFPSADDECLSHPFIPDERMESLFLNQSSQPTKNAKQQFSDESDDSDVVPHPKRIVVEAIVHNTTTTRQIAVGKRIRLQHLPLSQNVDDITIEPLRMGQPSQVTASVRRPPLDESDDSDVAPSPQQIVVEAMVHNTTSIETRQNAVGGPVHLQRLPLPQNLDDIAIDSSAGRNQTIPADETEAIVDLAQERAILFNEIQVQRRQRNLPTYLRAAERTLGDNNSQLYLGPLTQMCRFCDALHFRCEITTRGMYIKCCQKGNVVLPQLHPMPDLIANLFNGTHPQSNHFKQNILKYNNAFQFISLEANLRNLPPGRAPPVYCIQGKIYHHISNVNVNSPLQRYGPIYFLDPEEAHRHRLHNNENLLNPGLIQSIETMLRNVNVYAQAYMHLRERYDLEVETVERLRQQAANDGANVPIEMPIVTLELLSVRGRNNRPYDLPTVDEVAAVYRVNADTPAVPNLRIYTRQQPDRFRNVSHLSEIVDPLSFPLLFPRADPGWNMHLRHTNDQRSLTLCEYYAYRLAIRDREMRFQFGGKMTQQYVVAAYIKIESSRLEFIVRNQGRLRAEQYVGLADYLHRRILQNDDEEIAALGRMVILPSTFVGSPRAQQQNFQDAMAVCRTLGIPSLFITMTCNAKWREILENIPRGSQSNNHPLLISRVFQAKVNEFIKDIIECHVFGIVLANLCVVEFQKRGLPHVHILSILRNEDKPLEPIRIEQLISAEIPDPQVEPELYDIVTKNMVHNPCGNINPDAPCMKDGKCSKGFPKQFSEVTVTDENARTVYKRPNNHRTITVMVNGNEHVVDNRWIVPYNAYCLLKYNCHINVESCATTASVKYLYKYFFKDIDHSLVRINADFQQLHYNEVEIFLNARYMSPPEASWHILQFPMLKNTHTVYRLCVHLPQRQIVRFEHGFERQALDRHEVTQLTAWFTLNQTDPNANQYLYTEIPLHYVWHSGEKRWKKRQRGADKVITRMYSVNFRNQELYYLRVLLLHVRGARSYEDLRTVDGTVCHTFLEACQRRNLLADDVEWRHALREASQRDMPFQLRNMFAYMLIFCEVSDKLALWEEFQEHFVEDFVRRQMDPDEAVQRALAAIQNVLMIHGTRLSQFGLPEPTINIHNDEVVDVEHERIEGQRMRAQLNAEQLTAFNAIFDAINNDDEPNRLFVLNAAAGTGKSFLLQTLITILRSENVESVCLAPTGLAASLLKGGRTIHSRFRLPLDINETTTSGISPNSAEGNRIKAAKLIVIDEISMVTRAIFNIVDKALRDICNDNRPFGNRTVVLSGDFRQTLPIVIGGHRALIVDACVKSSHRWHLFRQLNLLTNVRAGEEQQRFSEWLLELGNGTLPAFRRTSYGTSVEIPRECIANSKDELISFCFENLNAGEIPNTAILTPLNLTCQQINDMVVTRLPGQNRTYSSADSVDLSDDPAAEVANYAVEFLNTLTPSGFPPHRLNLKVGAIVLLLRNLNISSGLCNGTRLIIRTLGNRYIDAEKLNNEGQPNGERVFIPRIDLISANNVLPFTLRRRQFPVKLAYGMTINKSQGQTFDKVGIYLPNPVFGHGQLYVAFSRTKSFQNVRVFLEPSPVQGKLNAPNDNTYTTNIVYREVL